MSTSAASASKSARLAAAVMSFGALLLLTFFVYGRVFESRPFAGDNLYILSWADRTPASALLRVDPDFYPEWRPLAYQSVWLQYRWFELAHLNAYYIVNVLLWTACGWVIYRIVDVLADSTVAGLAAAAVVITDRRATAALTLIVERQAAMACLFGLIGLLIVISARKRRLTRLGWTGVSFLLLASALSKEYGLAFAGALAVSSLCERRHDVTLAAVAAAVGYACLRIGFAGGATGHYCEESAYFFDFRTVCFDGFRASVAGQIAYNVAANGLGSVLPGLFTEEGLFAIAPRRLALSAVWLAAGILGWRSGPKSIRTSVLVVALNAALGFLLYRERNHLVALCALGTAIGAGVAVADARLRAFASSRPIRVIAGTILVCLLTAQAMKTRDMVSTEVDKELSEDPCSEVGFIRHLDAAFVRRVKTTYNLQNPECANGR